MIDAISTTTQSKLGSNGRTRAIHAELRRTINKAVGSVFYAPLLQSSRNSTLKSDFGHGGRGEDIFRAQLDGMLAERAGQASAFGVGKVLFDRFAAAAVAFQEQNSK